MRLEFMPLHLNVVRFPLERRLPPSLRVLRAIAPDLREAAMVAEAFGLPGSLRSYGVRPRQRWPGGCVRSGCRRSRRPGVRRWP